MRGLGLIEWDVCSYYFGFSYLHSRTCIFGSSNVINATSALHAPLACSGLRSCIFGLCPYHAFVGLHLSVYYVRPTTSHVQIDNVMCRELLDLAIHESTALPARCRLTCLSLSNTVASCPFRPRAPSPIGKSLAFTQTRAPASA